MKIAQEAVGKGFVDANLLRNLLNQVTSDNDWLKDDKYLLVIKSLCMSKNKTGKDSIVNFYEELQRRFPKSSKHRSMTSFLT